MCVCVLWTAASGWREKSSWISLFALDLFQQSSLFFSKMVIKMERCEAEKKMLMEKKGQYGEGVRQNTKVKVIHGS